MPRGNDESFEVILSNLAYEVLRQRLLSWCAEFTREEAGEIMGDLHG